MRYETDTTAGERATNQAQGDHQPTEASKTESRRQHSHSAVVLSGETVITGTPDGAIQMETVDGTTRWSTEQTTSGVSSLAVSPNWVVAGHRGPEGRVSVRSRDSGRIHWEYITAEDVGSPKSTAAHAQPTVTETVITADLIFLAARRIERERTQCSSVVYAFSHDGCLQWARDTEWPVTGITHGDGQLGVSYHNWPADSDSVLLLEAATGTVQARWSPTPEGNTVSENTAGDGVGTLTTGVGDITAGDGAIAVASHTDQYGYLLARTGTERWGVNLGGEYTVSSETVYTNPEYVTITDELVIFVTGRTQRQSPTTVRHPAAHTVIAVNRTDGTFAWKHQLDGPPLDIAHHGSRLAIATATHHSNGGSVTVLSTDGELLVENHFDGLPAAVDCTAESVTTVEENLSNQADGDCFARHMTTLPAVSETTAEQRVNEE